MNSTTVTLRTSKEPITPDTLFGIASCSKAFTATAIAMLIADGKMNWDDPVRKHLPAYRMSDALADRVTVRSADHRKTIELTFDRPVSVRVQDASAFGDPSFQIYAPVAEGTLVRGVEHALAISIKTTLAPDNSDASVMHAR